MNLHRKAVVELPELRYFFEFESEDENYTCELDENDTCELDDNDKRQTSEYQD